MGFELGVREWMLLAGVALVVVILLDAIRRALKQRAENERLMRAKRSERQEPHADFGWLKELPNGGARVVYRGEEESEQAHGVGDPEEEVSTDHDKPSHEVADAGLARPSTEEPQADLTALTIDAQGETEPATDVDTINSSDPDVLPDTESEGAAASSGFATAQTPAVTKLAETQTGQTVDWLETLDTEEVLPEEAPTLIDDSPPDHVLLIHLKADDNKPYRGDTLLQLLLACDLRFGDLGFFHRHEHSGGRGPIQFSVANLLKPGVFEIDSMSNLETAGIVFFMRVPGPKDLLTAYEAMLETARAVVHHLGGTLLDHSHSVLTKQAVEHDKTLLREYARKQLLKKRS